MGAPLIEECKEQVLADGIHPENLLVQSFLEMRYVGQSFELSVPLTKDFERNFHQLHRIRYGYADEEKENEIVNLRFEVIGKRPSFRWTSQKIKENLNPQASKIFPCHYQGITLELPLYERDTLVEGMTWEGPCLITEYSATTFIPPKCLGRIDPWKNLLMELPNYQKDSGIYAV